MGTLGKWFYFSDSEDVLYCTLHEGRVWKLADGDTWGPIPASFTQLSRFNPYLRDVTAEERKRIPAPPPERVSDGLTELGGRLDARAP